MTVDELPKIELPEPEKKSRVNRRTRLDITSELYAGSSSLDASLTVVTGTSVR